MVVEIVLYGFLAIVVAAALFALATRFLPAGEQIAPPLRDEPVWNLPAERNLHPEDVDSVRLPVALRGYRFAETDVLLDRLVHELRVRDAEIARLRAPDQAPSDAPTNGPSPRPDGRGDSVYARPTPAAPYPEQGADPDTRTESDADLVRHDADPAPDDAGYAPLSFTKTDDAAAPPPYADPATPGDPDYADRPVDTDHPGEHDHPDDPRRRDDTGP